jgi:formylglycine-generating enzyme required for sulfatase activity
VLFIDQFEVYFSLSAESRAAFDHEFGIWSAARVDGVHVVLVLREDALGRLAELDPLFANPLAITARLTSLRRPDAESAILNPAQHFGISYSPGVLNHILDELATSSHSEGRILPAYLQIVCTRLIDGLEPGTQVITTDNLARLGGIAKILHSYAEQALSSLSVTDQARAWRILKRATKSDSSRTSLSPSALCANDAEVHVLAVLTERRLIRRLESGDYELSHDRLAQTVRATMTQEEAKLVDMADMARSAYHSWIAYRVPLGEELGRVLLVYCSEPNFLLEPDIRDWLRATNRRLRLVRWRIRALWVLVAAMLLLTCGVLFYYYPLLTTKKPKYEWTDISAGRMLIGDDGNPRSRPKHEVVLRPFRLGKYEVTNEQYSAFVKATRRTPSGPHTDQEPEAPLGPIRRVTWYDANAFCHWIGGRLPTEAEWEMAATWDPVSGQKLAWPWGDTWSAEKLKSFEGGLSATAPVDSYPEGKSPWGNYHMVGNVAEWTSTIEAPYPYRDDDGREDPNALGPRIMRGSSYSHLAGPASPTNRSGLDPAYADPQVGFRCASDAALERGKEAK